MTVLMSWLCYLVEFVIGLVLLHKLDCILVLWVALLLAQVQDGAAMIYSE